jgi:hypothetical protein
MALVGSSSPALASWISVAQGLHLADRADGVGTVGVQPLQGGHAVAGEALLGGWPDRVRRTSRRRAVQCGQGPAPRSTSQSSPAEHCSASALVSLAVPDAQPDEPGRGAGVDADDTKLGHRASRGPTLRR